MMQQTAAACHPPLPKSSRYALLLGPSQSHAWFGAALPHAQALSITLCWISARAL